MRIRFDFKKQIFEELYFNLGGFLVYAFQYHNLIFSGLFLFFKQDNLNAKDAKVYAKFAKQ